MSEIERRPGVLRTILGRDQDDEDQPLPDLPPLPDDPRWRIEHMPMVVAAGFALVLCAASVGFFVDGATAALGAAAGVFIVTIGYSMSTLAVAWADAIRPALVMPIGMTAYVLKYLLIGFVMVSVAARAGRAASDGLGHRRRRGGVDRGAGVVGVPAGSPELPRGWVRPVVTTSFVAVRSGAALEEVTRLRRSSPTLESGEYGVAQSNAHCRPDNLSLSGG